MEKHTQLNLNEEAHYAARAEARFLDLCNANDVSVMLDVGANTGQFGQKIRNLGYKGLIVSFEPQLACREALRSRAAQDTNWVVMPNMGAGATNATMTLNVTENSYSSSFFTTRDDFLQIEPAARVTRTEVVPVRQLACSLSPGLARRVGALKIDTQGFELEVLKGLGDRFPALSVILVELSKTAVYVGAPLMEEVDAYLQNTLGFRRVHLEPAYHDVSTGEVLEFDGVYLRDDVGAAPRAQGIDIEAVITSIGKPYKRPDFMGRDWGANWQNSCAASWKRFAPRTVSISELSTNVDGVEWRATKNKPRMIEFMQHAAAITKSQFLLTNADILLTDHFKAAVTSLDPEVFYFGQRMEVVVDPDNPQELVAQRYYKWGFDFFLLPRSCVERMNRERLIPTHLRIGEPWWDYALPLLVMHMGYAPKQLVLKPPAVLHYYHKNVSNKWWLEQGQQFLQWCQGLQAAGGSPIAGLLTELENVIARFKNEPQKQLVEACKVIVGWMA